MRHLSTLALLCGALLVSLSPAQDTAPSPASPGATQPQTPQASPGTAPSPQPSTSQPQQPAPMQPGTSPPTEPQGSAQTPQAQSPSAANPASPTAAQTQTKIAPGSVIPVQLAKSIDAKKAKMGDEVVATVTQDMKTQTGEVLVPKDTQVIGHVTASQARSKEQKQSEVGIAFDHAVVKGDQMPLPMSIQAVIAPPSANPANAGGSNDQNAPAMAGNAPSGSAPSSPMGGGRSSGSTSTSPPPAAENAPPADSPNPQAQANSRPVINGQTEGVIGISNLKLDSAQNPAQGSVLSSEKNNVKVDKGTLMLLRVNQ